MSKTDDQKGVRSKGPHIKRDPKTGQSIVVRRATLPYNQAHVETLQRGVSHPATDTLPSNPPGWAELNRLRIKLARLYPQAVDVQEIMDDVRS